MECEVDLLNPFPGLQLTISLDMQKEEDFKEKIEQFASQLQVPVQVKFTLTSFQFKTIYCAVRIFVRY